MVKNQPIADIWAESLFLRYALSTTKQQMLRASKRLYPLVLSRSDWNRRTLLCVMFGFVEFWLWFGWPAAIVSGGALYVILGMIFLVSAFSAWRQDKDGKGEK